MLADEQVVCHLREGRLSLVSRSECDYSWINSISSNLINCGRLPSEFELHDQSRVPGSLACIHRLQSHRVTVATDYPQAIVLI